MSAATRVFEARLASVPRAVAFIEEVCAPAQVGPRDRLRLELVIEELFTNTVVHGHHGDSDAPVTVTLEVHAEQVALTYEDTAPPFDPLTAPMVDVRSAEDRPVGKLGLVLVRGMATDLAYAHREGRNRIALTVRFEEPRGAGGAG